MNTTADALKKDIEQGKTALKTLRDEIRLRIHLAGMDAKDEWRILEPRVEKVEAAAREATDATRKALRETVSEVKKFMARLG